MPLTITQVDAFADRPFAGNPAAVCVLASEADPAWMQDVAREMNLSETAFLVPRDQDDGFDLRWFTPVVEVELCGHATLASAHVLWESGLIFSDQTARFSTRSGWLTARRLGELIELDFPARPSISESIPDGLARALGCPVLSAGRNGMDLLVEVGTEAEIVAIRPDFAALGKIPVRGVIVTAPSRTADRDFVSRFFAPSCGVDEDPVTGSAHCALGPFWADRLGKTALIGYQASARGGTVRVEVFRDRVRLAGTAVTVMRGELLATPFD